ncbi:hypothetical protein, variant [Phialophora macrospora]|nr:hypothetical protein, variant [Phialophora macrospora]
MPCSSCIAKSQVCTYGKRSSHNQGQDSGHHISGTGRLAIDWSQASPFDLFAQEFFGQSIGPHSLDNDTLETVVLATDARGYTKPGVRFEFLLHFVTSPGLDGTFNWISCQQHSGMSDNWLLASFLEEDDMPPSTAYHNQQAARRSSEKNAQLFEMMCWMSHPMFVPSKKLWTRLQCEDARVCYDHNRHGSRPLSVDADLDFFNPMNLDRFVHLYWERWHFNGPIVHKATFDINAASPEMIFAFALTGAFMSNDEADVAGARSWLDVVEEVVFQHPLLSEHPVAPTCEGQVMSLRERLELIQAALLISVLQNWEGSEASRRRIRRSRFSSVIFAARDIGFAEAKHTNDFNLELRHVDWEEFILREELIRTQTFIFLLDADFMIFHNVPPRIGIPELTFSFSCTAACFEATTPDELWAAIDLDPGCCWQTQDFTLRGAVELMCREGASSADVLKSLRGLTTLNLFAVVSALHSLLFTQQMSLSLSSSETMSRLRNALHMWAQLWERRRRVPDCAVPSSAHISVSGDTDGIYRHADEWQAFALAKLDRLTATGGTVTATAPSDYRDNASTSLQDVADLLQAALP